MKNVFLALLISLLVAQSRAQTATTISGLVEVKLPQGFLKQTVEEKWRALKANKNSIINRADKGSFFKLNSGILMLNATKGKLGKGHLEGLKAGFDDLLKDYGTGYSSIIKKVNGHDVLIFQFVRDGIQYYNFTVLNSSRTISFGGALEDVEKNKAKSEEMINDILKSLKFKEE